MHNEYKHLVDGAEIAILFVHGIVGTPDHFAPLLPLVPANISVHNLLLDGHGKGVREFSKTSMKAWETQVCTATDRLAQTHKEVWIVGHSLGSLLAIDTALQNPGVTRLFLLAVPLRLSLKPHMFRNAWKVNSGRIDPEDPVAVAAQACCGVTPSKNLLLYLGWIPRYLELFAKIRKTRKQIGQLTLPCSVFQSAGDEMVSRQSTRLLSQNPHISVQELRNSGHYYYENSDFQLLKNGFSQLF